MDNAAMTLIKSRVPPPHAPPGSGPPPAKPGAFIFTSELAFPLEVPITTSMATLNDGKRHLLNEYLLEKRPLIEERNPSAVEVTEWCRENLKFGVDVGNVTSRVGPEGVLYKHEWPGSETSRKGRLTDRAKQLLIIEQMELLRRDLKRLGMALGEPSYGRAYKGWEDLVAISQTDLADVDQRDDLEK